MNSAAHPSRACVFGEWEHSRIAGTLHRKCVVADCRNVSLDGDDLCHECGTHFEIDDRGIANHIGADGDVDYDADADHVPYSLDVDD